MRNRIIVESRAELLVVEINKTQMSYRWRAGLEKGWD
jgi:hypothetical protein